MAHGGTSTTFTLDAAGRRSAQTTTDASGTTTTTRRYTDDTDSPAWIETSGPAGTTTTRYAQGIDGDLSASIAADGTVTLSLSNAHGDVVTTVDIPATQAGTTPASGIDGWADYTEYGAAAVSSSPAAISAVAGVAGYSWLGAKQRSATDATAGLMLMGVRLYNPATGQFTTLDPVPGGNTTAYVYPQDPINQFDLNGMWWSWLKKAAKVVTKVAAVASFIPGPIGMVASGIAAAGYAVQGDYGSAALYAVGTVVWGAGRYGGLVSKYASKSRAVGVGSRLLARGGKGKSILNGNDYARVGWSWKGSASKGRNVVRFASGSKQLPWRLHYTIFN